MTRLVTIVLVFVTSTVYQATAEAQVLPPWLLVRPESVAESPPASRGASTFDLQSEYRQSRARSILAAGVGFLASAAVHLAYALPPTRCSNHTVHTRSLTTAGVVGGLGLSMTVGGAWWLSAESRRHGSYGSAQGRLGALGIAALSAIPSQAMLFGMYLSDGLACRE